MINYIKGEVVRDILNHIIDVVLKMSNQNVLSNRRVNQNKSRVY